MSYAADLVGDLRAALAARADPARAAGTQAYLKTTMPMFGVPRPEQQQIFRRWKDRPPPDREAWERAVLAAWAGPERELKYAAVAIVRGWRGRFLDLDVVPLLVELVRDGAWWDLVDELAVHAVGTVVARHRAEMRPILERWIDDPDVWVRRTAILAQVAHGERTDAALLFAFCARQAPEKSFWVRKAIGWALRSYARVDPDAVRAFLAAEGTALSGLSRREASKHL